MFWSQREKNKISGILCTELIFNMKIFVDFKSNKMYTGSELLMQNEDIYKTAARKTKRLPSTAHKPRISDTKIFTLLNACMHNFYICNIIALRPLLHWKKKYRPFMVHCTMEKKYIWRFVSCIIIRARLFVRFTRFDSSSIACMYSVNLCIFLSFFGFLVAILLCFFFLCASLSFLTLYTYVHVHCTECCWCIYIYRVYGGKIKTDFM